MTDMDERYRSNEPDVAAKVIDGEAILINLGNGMYYSLDLVGGLIWSLAERHYSVAEMATAVSARYDIASDRASADSGRIVGELMAEGLLARAEPGTVAIVLEDDPIQSGQPYEAPQLMKFDDMADIFALDPPLPDLPEATGAAAPNREVDGR